MSVLFVNSENHSIETIAQKDPPFNPTLVEQCIKVLKIFLYYLFLPITYCFTLAAKSLLYVSVFPMTTYDSDLGRWIIKTFGGYKVDLIRVEESKKALNFMGAEQVEVHTVDGEKIQVMRMTQENFRNKIEALGGSFVDYQVELDSNNSKSYTVTEGKSCSHTLQVIEFSDSDPDILSNVQMSLQQLGLQEVDVKINNKQKTVFQFSLRSLRMSRPLIVGKLLSVAIHLFIIILMKKNIL